MNFHDFINSFLVFALLFSQGGCGEVRQATAKTWHQKFDWKAEGFFDDPQIIALCKAIEAEDIKEIDRLVAAGTDVNAKGKGNMTPLLWAYPDNKPERLKRLLEHGADPNVIFESDFNTGQKASFPGGSVTHMASSTWFPKYFDYVFQHGGNPNLKKSSILGRGETPLFTVIKNPSENSKAKVQRLIELGTDLDHVCVGLEITPAIMATNAFAQFDIALQLLQAGANPKIYMTNSNMKLAHLVARANSRLPQCTPQQKKDYKKLAMWLEKNGESLAKAQADLDRWRSWSGTRKEKKMRRDKEVAERKAREKREQDAIEHK